jgi:hypothetical protein
VQFLEQFTLDFEFEDLNPATTGNERKYTEFKNISSSLKNNVLLMNILNEKDSCSVTCLKIIAVKRILQNDQEWEVYINLNYHDQQQQY